MDKDTEVTKVVFKIVAPWQIQGRRMPREVVAFFPDTTDASGIMTSYMRVGQHGDASVEFAQDCKSAKPEQYADLKEELESIGYNLKVVKE